MIKQHVNVTVSMRRASKTTKMVVISNGVFVMLMRLVGHITSNNNNAGDSNGKWNASVVIVNSEST